MNEKLDAKHVRSREHRGRAISYVEGWHAITEANRIFGCDAWDRETVSCQMVWQGTANGESNCAYVARVKIRVRAGETVIVREGSGFGFGAGNTPGEAHENAIKEAETDAMKRALVTFGNPFGLALYDRNLTQIRGWARKPPSSRDVEWKLRSADGSVAATHTDPVAWCAALKRAFLAIQDAEVGAAIWAQHRETVERLRDMVPNLKTGKDRHYVDVLQALCEARMAKLGSVGTPVTDTVAPEPVRTRCLVPAFAGAD